jgi:hypothetical protein
MNHYPWYVENAASYKQKRIQDDMRQIRLERQALKAKGPTKVSARSRGSLLRAVRHATLVMAKAVMTILG